MAQMEKSSERVRPMQETGLMIEKNYGNND